MKYKKWLKLVQDLYNRFNEDEIPALGAQLTYYLVLSFFPFLIFIINLLSYTPITGQEALRDLSGFLPSNAYSIVLEILQQVTASRSGTLLSFGMIATLWAASNGVVALIRGINKAYDQDETRSFWKVRWVSILFTLALSVLIIFSFILLIFGEMLGKYIFSLLGFPYLFNTIWDIIRYIIPLVMMMAVFICLYRCTPNRRLNMKQVMPGSIFSTLGWIFISTVFSYYVNSFDIFSKMYGSIGGIILLLIWLYWSGIIILLGGELNATLFFYRERKKKL